MTEASKTLYLGYVKLMYPFNKTIQGKRPGKVLRLLEESITEPMREIVLRGLLFSFKDIKDKELEKYAEFLNSEAGSWFSQTTLKGFEKGIKRNLHQAGQIQEDLLKEIKSGGPEFPLVKEIAEPGQRYLLIGKRDPFQPLVNSGGLVLLAEEGQMSKARLFGEELGDIPPIALLVFAKIEDLKVKVDDENNILTVSVICSSMVHDVPTSSAQSCTELGLELGGQGCSMQRSHSSMPCPKTMTLHGLLCMLPFPRLIRSCSSRCHLCLEGGTAVDIPREAHVGLSMSS